MDRPATDTHPDPRPCPTDPLAVPAPYLQARPPARARYTNSHRHAATRLRSAPPRGGLGPPLCQQGVRREALPAPRYDRGWLVASPHCPRFPLPRTGVPCRAALSTLPAYQPRAATRLIRCRTVGHRGTPVSASRSLWTAILLHPPGAAIFYRLSLPIWICAPPPSTAMPEKEHDRKRGDRGRRGGGASGRPAHAVVHRTGRPVPPGAAPRRGGAPSGPRHGGRGRPAARSAAALPLHPLAAGQREPPHPAHALLAPAGLWAQDSPLRFPNLGNIASPSGAAIHAVHVTCRATSDDDEFVCLRTGRSLRYPRLVVCHINSLIHEAASNLGESPRYLELAEPDVVFPPAESKDHQADDRHQSLTVRFCQRHRAHRLVAQGILGESTPIYSGPFQDHQEPGASDGPCPPSPSNPPAAFRPAALLDGTTPAPLVWAVTHPAWDEPTDESAAATVYVSVDRPDGQSLLAGLSPHGTRTLLAMLTLHAHVALGGHRDSDDRTNGSVSMLLESLHFTRIHKRLDKSFAVCAVPTLDMAADLTEFGCLSLTAPGLGPILVRFDDNAPAPPANTAEQRAQQALQRKALLGPHTLLFLSPGMALPLEILEDLVAVCLVVMARGHTLATVGRPDATRSLSAPLRDGRNTSLLQRIRASLVARFPNPEATPWHAVGLDFPVAVNVRRGLVTRDLPPRAASQVYVVPVADGGRQGVSHAFFPGSILGERVATSCSVTCMDRADFLTILAAQDEGKSVFSSDFLASFGAAALRADPARYAHWEPLVSGSVPSKPVILRVTPHPKALAALSRRRARGAPPVSLPRYAKAHHRSNFIQAVGNLEWDPTPTTLPTPSPGGETPDASDPWVPPPAPLHTYPDHPAGLVAALLARLLPQTGHQAPGAAANPGAGPNAGTVIGGGAPPMTTPETTTGPDAPAARPASPPALSASSKRDAREMDGGEEEESAPRHPSERPPAVASATNPRQDLDDDELELGTAEDEMEEDDSHIDAAKALDDVPWRRA